MDGLAGAGVQRTQVRARHGPDIAVLQRPVGELEEPRAQTVAVAGLASDDAFGLHRAQQPEIVKKGKAAAGGKRVSGGVDSDGGQHRLSKPKSLSPAEQKQELLAALDLAKSLRLNAVIFQVRPMADAIYKPGLEPWSEFLTGQMGRSQDFDPLEFLVAEAHKRGILVHAWFNPYRAYHPAAKTISDDHVSKLHPEFVKQYGRYMWLDPTDPEARDWSLKVIKRRRSPI